jgi:hypothetical protein
MPPTPSWPAGKTETLSLTGSLPATFPEGESIICCSWYRETFERRLIHEREKFKQDKDRAVGV